MYSNLERNGYFKNHINKFQVSTRISLIFGLSEIRQLKLMNLKNYLNFIQIDRMLIFCSRALNMVLSFLSLIMQDLEVHVHMMMYFL